MKPETCSALRKFAIDTAFDGSAWDRVRQRLRGQVLDADASRVLLSYLPARDDAAEGRVRARVVETLASDRPVSWTVPVLALAAAALALGVTAATVGSTGGLADRDRELAAALVPNAGWTEVVELTGVRARVEGTGALAGRESQPVVVWHEGWIELEVDPELGPDVVVTTPEARVAVTGTVFRVARDALGTEVSVTRGSVDVACGEWPARPVRTGETHRCLPTTPAGLLGRAQALARKEAPWERVIDTIDTALPEADGAVRAELLVLRMEQLVRASWEHEALADAEAYLAEGIALRRGDVATMAARSALRTGGCDRALPFLRLLAEEQSAGPAELASLERCQR